MNDKFMKSLRKHKNKVIDNFHDLVMRMPIMMPFYFCVGKGVAGGNFTFLL